MIDDIPAPQKLWLKEAELPDDVYPWRKDEHGPQEFVRNVHEFDKPKDEQVVEPIIESLRNPLW